MSKSLKKAVLQYNKFGHCIQHWDSASDVEKALGIAKENVGACCRGWLKTSGGYIWRYADNPIPQNKQGGEGE